MFAKVKHWKDKDLKPKQLWVNDLDDHFLFCEPVDFEAIREFLDEEVWWKLLTQKVKISTCPICSALTGEIHFVWLLFYLVSLQVTKVSPANIAASLAMIYL